MNRIAVVTDSTANLPAELREAYGIPFIPLTVNWSGETFLDGVTLAPEAFYRQLPLLGGFPRTSQPSPGAFMKFFQEVAETQQTDTIVGIFISSGLSGTLSAAKQAQAELPDLHIELVDSLSTSMGLGFQVVEAARVAQEGADLDTMLRHIHDVRERMNVIFAVDTLEYLHRGGRIGGAARLVGTALNIKPVLAIESGKIEPLEKVRGRRKSLRRVVNKVEQHLNGQHLAAMSIVHAEAPKELALLKQWIHDRFAPEALYETVFSPVIGAHTGPGTIGIVFYTNGLEV